MEPQAINSLDYDYKSGIIVKVLELSSQDTIQGHMMISIKFSQLLKPSVN